MKDTRIRLLQLGGGEEVSDLGKTGLAARVRGRGEKGWNPHYRLLRNSRRLVELDEAPGMAHEGPDDGKEIAGCLASPPDTWSSSKQIAGELMAYEIAGFHFDMLQFNFAGPCGCFCQRCRELFRKKYGTDMPKGVTWDENWDRMLQFRCDSNTRFCRELQDFVHAKRPELSVDYNYHGYPPFSWILGELPAQHAPIWGLCHRRRASLGVRLQQPEPTVAVHGRGRPGGPVQGVTSRSAFNYHDFSVRPAADLKWETLTYLAHGAQCTIVDKADYDGTLDPVVYQSTGEAFGEARSKREYFGHKPVPEVGLTIQPQPGLVRSGRRSRKVHAWLLGRAPRAVQAHIPLGMIMDENLSMERLRQFPVVYLANTAIVTEEEAAIFDEYVSGGGRLLVTGLTGNYDRYGKLRDKNVLQDVLGGQVVKCYIDARDNCLRFPRALGEGNGGFLLAGVPADWPLLTCGPAVGCKPHGAEAFGELLIGYRPNPWNGPTSEKIVSPAVFVHDRGKGKVIYVPCAIDAAFVGDYCAAEHRNLIHNFARHLNPSPPVLVQAPRNVDIVVTRDQPKRRLLVHFLCFSAPPTFVAGPFQSGRRVLPPQMEEVMDYRRKSRSIGRFPRYSRQVRRRRCCAKGKRSAWIPPASMKSWSLKTECPPSSNTLRPILLRSYLSLLCWVSQ